MENSPRYMTTNPKSTFVAVIATILAAIALISFLAAIVATIINI